MTQEEFIIYILNSNYTKCYLTFLFFLSMLNSFITVVISKLKLNFFGGIILRINLCGDCEKNILSIIIVKCHIIQQQPFVYLFFIYSWAYLSYFYRFFNMTYFESSWFFIADNCCYISFCLFQNYFRASEDILAWLTFYLFASSSPNDNKMGLSVVKNYDMISPLFSPIAFLL